ncbi:MAG: DJ-1/PfpI family protein [Actinomycetota bacterium]|nr:DJ-1/PfpI family protein [Actinomycetota bacterium]
MSAAREPGHNRLQIAVLLYPQLTTLDAIGPYEVLRELPGAQVTFVGKYAGPVRDEHGLTLLAEASIEELPNPDVLLVPGGRGTAALLNDQGIHDWLRRAHETSIWTTAVCTGSLLLGAAGLLRGKRATTYWRRIDRLREYGAEPVKERFVFDGRIVTAAGVSAGIDMALALAARIAGEDTAKAIQLAIEYDPQPPFDCGSPDKAPESIHRALADLARGPAPAT